MLRIDTPELLDEDDAPQADVERSLRDLRRINRWLGGGLVYRRLLRRAGAEADDVILDVGSGTGDLLEGTRSRLGIAVDRKIDHLLRVQDRSIRRVVADAFALPFRNGSADFVTSAHFFHHFDAQQNLAILNESLRVARRAVVVNDTRRHRVPLLTIQLLGVLRLVGRITRFDGPASVRRGYTATEAAGIARQSAAARWKVVNALPYRFGITLWK